MNNKDKDVIDNLHTLQKELESVSKSLKGKHGAVEREKEFLNNLLTDTTNNFHTIVKNLNNN